MARRSEEKGRDPRAQTEQQQESGSRGALDRLRKHDRRDRRGIGVDQEKAIRVECISVFAELSSGGRMLKRRALTGLDFGNEAPTSTRDQIIGTERPVNRMAVDLGDPVSFHLAPFDPIARVPENRLAPLFTRDGRGRSLSRTGALEAPSDAP